MPLQFALVITISLEPLISRDAAAATDPAEQMALEESVSMALLVVLETLSPAERAVFVLHDVFGFDCAAVADMVGRDAACPAGWSGPMCGWGRRRGSSGSSFERRSAAWWPPHRVERRGRCLPMR
jgi:hypothetical protein